MTHDQLKRAAALDPFVPFVSCVADGHRISVTHPEAIRLSQDPARVCSVDSPDGKQRIIDILLVTTLEYDPGTQSARSA